MAWVGAATSRSAVALLGALVTMLAVAARAAGQADVEPEDFRVRAAVTVTTLDLDASATSKDGAPVLDLRADEIVLKIDGRPVPLDYFTLVRAGRPAAPAASGAGDPVPRSYFLVIDEDHIAPEERGRVFEAARSLVSRLDPSDRLAAAVLQQGRLRSLAAAGTNAEVLGKRLSEHEMSGLSNRSTSVARLRGQMALASQRDSLRLLERAVRGFGTHPGRKEMVLLSRGVSQDDVSVRRAFDDLVVQANRSRVTVHTLGAAGLAGGETPTGFT